MRKQLPKEALLELVYQGEYYDEEYELVVVNTRVLGQSRWSVFREMIIRDMTNGKYYVSEYSEGATEVQDESPYEYEPDMVEVTEVFRVKQIVSSFVSANSEFAQARSHMLGEVERLISDKYGLEQIGELADLYSDMEEIGSIANNSHMRNFVLINAVDEEGEE